MRIQLVPLLEVKYLRCQEDCYGCTARKVVVPDQDQCGSHDAAARRGYLRYLDLLLPDLPSLVLYRRIKRHSSLTSSPLICARDKDHVEIHSVTSLCDLLFEAQAFSLFGLSGKLSKARKRRMKRLLQSKNFVCEIRQARKRFVMINLNKAMQNGRILVTKLIDIFQIGQSMILRQRTFPISHRAGAVKKQIPNLERQAICQLGAVLSSGKSRDAISVSSLRPPTSLNSPSSYLSYAEVASKGLENDNSSKTPAAPAVRFAGKSFRADSSPRA